MILDAMRKIEAEGMSLRVMEAGTYRAHSGRAQESLYWTAIRISRSSGNGSAKLSTSSTTKTRRPGSFSAGIREKVALPSI